MSGSILTPARCAAGCHARTQGRGAEVRRANALVALDDGNDVGPGSRILHLDPDKVRCWLRGFRRTGLAPVDPAAYPEREGKLMRARETPPRDTNEVRDIILRRFGVEYTRGGAIHVVPGNARQHHAKALNLSWSGRSAASGRVPAALRSPPEPLVKFRLEKLIVRAKANEGDVVIRDPVDQQQVGHELALPTVFPIPSQGMVLQEFRQLLSRHEEINDVPEQINNLCIRLYLPPEILPETFGRVERHHSAPPFEIVAKSGVSPSIMSLAPTSRAVSRSALKLAAISPGVSC